MDPMISEIKGVILMGPFGSGKSYLGRRLNALGIAKYTELEPIVYDLFADESGLNVEMATKYIRAHYFENLSVASEMIAFESTGVVQRPLLLDVMDKFQIALIKVCTPKEVCLERVAQRNLTSKHPVEMSKAEAFYDYWMEEIAPIYNFALEVNGQDEQVAIEAIKELIQIR